MTSRGGKRSFIKELVQLWPGLPFLGLGVWLAWMLLAFSGTFWLSDIETDGRFISEFYLVSTSVSAFLLLLLPFLYKFVSRLLIKSKLVYFGALLVSLGAACIIAAGPFYLATRWLFLVGLYLTGIGAVPLTLKCGQLYGNLAPGKIVIYVVLSQLLVAIIYFFCLGAAWFHPIEGGPSLSGIVGLTMLPLLAAGLITQPALPSPADDNSSAQTKTQPSTFRSAVAELHYSFWKLCVAVLFFAIVTSVVRGQIVHLASPLDTFINNSIRMLLQMLFAGVFLYFMLRYVKQLNFGKIYLMLMVGIAVILTLASSLPMEGGIFNVFAGLALNIFEMVLWCLLAFIVQQKRVSFVIVFGFGYGVFMTGSAIGWMVGAWLFPLVPTPILSSFIFVFLAAIVLVCAILVFSEKDFDRLFSSVFEKELDLEKIMSLQAAIVTERSDSADSDESSHARPYMEACKRIGAAARLTNREQAVFELVALGRGQDDIARRLNISVNTARTHTNNIYLKFNVHSRQELIALVEAERKNTK